MYMNVSVHAYSTISCADSWVQLAVARGKRVWLANSPGDIAMHCAKLLRVLLAAEGSDLGLYFR